MTQNSIETAAAGGLVEILDDDSPPSFLEAGRVDVTITNFSDSKLYMMVEHQLNKRDFPGKVTTYSREFTRDSMLYLLLDEKNYLVQ